MEISEFNIDRGNYCKGTLEWYLIKTIQQILQDHGKETETYKLAEKYLPEVEKLQNEINDNGENSFEAEEKLEELEKEFTLELSEIYLSMLRNEYEYQMSKEAIIETIEANEYEFTIDGKVS